MAGSAAAWGDGVKVTGAGDDMAVFFPGGGGGTGLRIPGGGGGGGVLSCPRRARSSADKFGRCGGTAD
jgi:hypothetical protein